MATINFKCPHCGKNAEIGMEMHWLATDQSTVKSIEVQEAGDGEVIAFADDADAETTDKEQGELVAFFCRECDEEITDNEGHLIDSETGLAAWLEANGMLVRDNDEPKGKFATNFVVEGDEGD
jgi:hypothetical protein